MAPWLALSLSDCDAACNKNVKPLIGLAFPVFYPMMVGNIKSDMFQHRKYISRIGLVLACMALGTGYAYAAGITVQPRADFTRINFAFDQPAKLQVGGGGTSVILNFDQPIGQSITSLQPQLESIANGVQQSADGKQIVLNLKKNYRIRQFTSANTVGIDIMGSITPPAPTPPPEEAEVTPPAAEAPAPAAPPKAETVVEKPPAKPTLAPTPPPVEKPAAPVKVLTPPKAVPPTIAPKLENPAAQTVTVVKPTPAPVKPAEPVAKTPPPATEDAGDAKVIRVAPSPVLTTKKLEPEQPPLPEVPPAAALGPAPEPTIPKPVLTTKSPEPAPAPETPAAVASPAAPEAPPAPQPKPPVVVDSGPFLVGASPTNEGTRLDFPWKERVATAIFERGNDIWVVFSKTADANIALLRTVLPKSVITIDQFAYDGATVLRLGTDGTLHATASQPANSYTWRVLLSSQIPTTALDIPVSNDKDKSGKTYLQLNAFDVAAPLQFYDPQIGDMLVVIPTFELGRGVANQKTAPGLTILRTQQGIAVASLRDDLTTTHGRTGIKLFGGESLPVSQNLPVLSSNAAPVPGVTATSSVMIPYEQWYVAPADFVRNRAARLQTLTTAPAANKPEAMMDMVRLYLGQGMATEALGYLQLIQQFYPEYYVNNKLAMLTAASDLLTNRLPEARLAIDAPELQDLKEAQLWRDAIGLFAPPPSAVQQLVQAAATPEAEKPAEGQSATPPAAEAVPAAPPPRRAEFDFMKYNKQFIRFYPPRIRQRLAIMAADYYLDSGQPDQAVLTYDSLNGDGILEPVQPYAELMIGRIAAAKDKNKEALVAFDRLAKQHDDLYVQARARYEALMLRYNRGMLPPQAAIDGLEHLRISWRGDGLEREMLVNLAHIYTKEKQYDNTLRSWKYLLQSFPGDPDTLTIAGDMTELFEDLFLHGMADDMTPLKSLALFYEFRELTPIGTPGDEIIQKLADRLAAVDLLDRATQLLEHQVKFRVGGEMRARVGARLGLLYLLNKQPKRALEILETTNYGEMPTDLRRHRLQLTAQALAENGKPEEALSLLYNDASREGTLLRLDILWGMQDWPNVIDEAEAMLAMRPNLTDPLTTTETPVLLKLALAYSFEGDRDQLGYLRDYYMGLMADTQYKEIFDFITNDTTPLDTEDFALVAKQISRTESFLDSFKTQIAQGRLSDAVK